MADCVEPAGMFDAFAARADALDAWHDGGPGRAAPAGPAPTAAPRRSSAR